MVPFPPDLKIQELFERYDRTFCVLLGAIHRFTKYDDSPWALKNEIACHLGSLIWKGRENGNLDTMIEFVRDAPAWIDECSAYLRQALKL